MPKEERDMFSERGVVGGVLPERTQEIDGGGSLLCGLTRMCFVVLVYSSLSAPT